VARRTVGIDLSSQPEHTAACSIDWLDGRAMVVGVEVAADDDRITELMGGADKVGIDAPLGWPVAFAEAVHGHSRDGTWPDNYEHRTGALAMRYRRTDLWVWKDLGMRPPLSVSTDRIALPAMRAAALLAARAPGMALDGSGLVVEAYPAAALQRWGLRSRRYKGPAHLSTRRAMIDELRAGARWLEMKDDDLERCAELDDAFDAVIAALVARAAAVGLIERVVDADRALAKREGWIAVPFAGTLAELVRSP
jgi:predicted nuclease with RNAse H fold